MSVQAEILNIDGFSIRKGGLYKVVHKPDASAPDGYQQEGATKLPSEGIFNIVPMRYKMTDPINKVGRYDTGFETSSPVYGKMSEAATQARVEALNKAIVQPYEKKYGKRDLLSSDNEEFWDSYGVELKAGKIFNTANVDDLLGLYVAMMSHELCPVSKKSAPKYRDAAYMVEDKEKVREVRTTRAVEKFQTIQEFGELLKSNKATAVNILLYTGFVGASVNVDNDTIMASFMQYVEEHSNVEKFQRTLDIYKDKDRSDAIAVFAKLKQLVRKRVITRVKTTYQYDHEDLGYNLRDIAITLVVDSSKEDTMYKIMDA